MNNDHKKPDIEFCVNAINHKNGFCRFGFEIECTQFEETLDKVIKKHEIDSATMVCVFVKMIKDKIYSHSDPKSVLDQTIEILKKPMLGDFAPYPGG